MRILRTLINFSAGLAGGRVQLAIWAIVLLGGGFYIANHLRVVKEKAMLEQRNADLEERAKAAETDYAAALADLETERAKLSTLQESQARERAAIAGVRAQISAGLAQGFGDIAAKGTTIDTEIRPLTGAAVNDRARSAIASATAAAIELDRIRASH